MNDYKILIEYMVEEINSILPPGKTLNVEYLMDKNKEEVLIVLGDYSFQDTIEKACKYLGGMRAAFLFMNLYALENPKKKGTA